MSVAGHLELCYGSCWLERFPTKMSTLQPLFGVLAVTVFTFLSPPPAQMALKFSWNRHGEYGAYNTPYIITTVNSGNVHILIYLHFLLISGKESLGIGPRFVRSFYTSTLLLLMCLELLRRPTSSLRSALHLRKTNKLPSLFMSHRILYSYFVKLHLVFTHKKCTKQVTDIYLLKITYFLSHSVDSSVSIHITGRMEGGSEEAFWEDQKWRHLHPQAGRGADSTPEGWTQVCMKWELEAETMAFQHKQGDSKHVMSIAWILCLWATAEQLLWHISLANL